LRWSSRLNVDTGRLLIMDIEFLVLELLVWHDEWDILCWVYRL
jgi:hypothetical protein